MSESGDQEEVYEVEKICKKKIDAGGKISYLIKWKDYPAEENTWEPIEHLECQDLIDEFEAQPDKIVIDEVKKKQIKKKPTVQKQTKVSSRTSSQTSNLSQQRTGFDEGLSVESILGATDSAGELMFLIKWKERNEASLIASKIAKQKCPQQVIEYLEKKITFVNE